MLSNHYPYSKRNVFQSFSHLYGDDNCLVITQSNMKEKSMVEVLSYTESGCLMYVRNKIKKRDLLSKGHITRQFNFSSKTKQILPHRWLIVQNQFGIMFFPTTFGKMPPLKANDPNCKFYLPPWFFKMSSSLIFELTLYVNSSYLS